VTGRPSSGMGSEPGSGEPKPGGDSSGRDHGVGRPLTLRVPSREAGQRLDVVVGGIPAVGSRSQAARLIDAGAVSVDGSPRPRSFRVAAGECIVVSATRPPLPSVRPETIPVDVPYEDRWLLVVDKPAGMVVHPAPGHPEGTLVNALLSRGVAGGDAERPGIVHRLDKSTSGLLIVARDEAVHRRLQRMLSRREIDRRYLALIHGEPTAAAGTIEAAVGRDPRKRTAMTVGGARARPAVTHFRVLERLPSFTLVEAKLDTGRTHQIRVHFQAIGHPVAGDPTYGRGDPLHIGRQFLHSHHLRFEHPVTGESVDVRSPLPPDLLEALRKARAGVPAR
jgi:23S rRNA pseudouridine1911/1915/1917 synthase